MAICSSDHVITLSETFLPNMNALTHADSTPRGDEAQRSPGHRTAQQVIPQVDVQAKISVEGRPGRACRSPLKSATQVQEEVRIPDSALCVTPSRFRMTPFDLARDLV